METNEIKKAIRHGAMRLIKGAEILTELDSQTGDGDHGLTMTKIANELIHFCDEQEPLTVADLFSGLAEAVLQVNGGSIVSLWAEMLFGAADALGEKKSLERSDLAVIVDGAIDGIGTISKAAPGDKTLLDTLLAVKTVCEEFPGREQFWALVGSAAEAGAESTRAMPAKYGRAKQLLDGSIGFLDPGAVSMSMFICGIAEYIGEKHAE